MMWIWTGKVSPGTNLIFQTVEGDRIRSSGGGVRDAKTQEQAELEQE